MKGNDGMFLKMDKKRRCHNIWSDKIIYEHMIKDIHGLLDLQQIKNEQVYLKDRRPWQWIIINLLI